MSEPAPPSAAEWAPLVQATIAAARGDTAATEALGPVLDQLYEKDSLRALGRSLSRVLAGEREPDTLLEGLDATDAHIVREVLAGLGVAAPKASAGEQAAPAREVGLDELLAMVAAACRPDAEPALATQLRDTAHAWAGDAATPEVQRELGRVIVEILDGERVPDLSRLPDEVAARVRGLLQELRSAGL
jgi:hypothetical protein